MQRRQENRDERDECPFRGDSVSDTAISCRFIANDGVRARVNCTPSDEQKPCWLLLVRFP